MKLAEALLLRTEYQQKILTLQNRVMQNLKVQENEKPFENPQELLSEMAKTNEKLCELIKQINARNNTAKLPCGKSLSDAIVERDMLMKKRQYLSVIASTAAVRDYRLTRTEIKMNVTISVEELQKEIDDISKKFREMDVQIQSLNWTVDL